MKIVLVGFMGSGKTTLGRRLANRLNHPFIDLDAEIELVTQKTVPEIFAEKGEKNFREIEQETLQDLLKKDKYVLATGGGAPCHGENMRIINQHADSIYLRIDAKTLANRLLSSKTERPLIKGKKPEELIEYIENKLEEREFFYNQSKHIISGFNLNVDDILLLLEG